MTIVVLVILAVLWAAVLLPPWLRNRSESRPADSISSFRRQLSVLERTGPAARATGLSLVAVNGSVDRSVVRGVHVSAPPPPVMNLRSAQKRRRDILFGLLGAMGASLILGLIPGMRLALVAHVAVDLLFAGYVLLLVRARQGRWTGLGVPGLATDTGAEREGKLRFLPTGAAPEPALLLRRSAN